MAQQKHLLFRRGEIRAGSVGTEELADYKRDGAVGYFFADTGTINQLVHVWKFEDDNDRRAFRRRLFADKNFMEAPDAGAMGSSSLTRWLALLKDVAVAVLGGARRLRDVLREVAVDRHTMLLIGSAIVAMLVIASVLVGPGGLLMSR